MANSAIAGAVPASPNPENEDPLFAKIQRAADVIRYVTTYTDSHPSEAWSKNQLIAMLDEIRIEADKILGLVGISDLELHFEDAWGSLSMERDCFFGDGSDRRYRPYEEA